jgi:hypothetical protein
MIGGMMHKYYKYLDELRDSGETNMMGAAVDLQQEFGMERVKARKILQEWMDQFSSAGSGR